MACTFTSAFHSHRSSDTLYVFMKGLYIGSEWLQNWMKFKVLWAFRKIKIHFRNVDKFLQKLFIRTLILKVSFNVFFMAIILPGGHPRSKTLTVFIALSTIVWKEYRRKSRILALRKWHVAALYYFPPTQLSIHTNARNTPADLILESPMKTLGLHACCTIQVYQRSYTEFQQVPVEQNWSSLFFTLKWTYKCWLDIWREPERNLSLKSFVWLVLCSYMWLMRSILVEVYHGLCVYSL